MIEDDDLAACRAAMRSGSRSFFLASRLLPRPVRAHATALYAFCRAADDAIDQGGRDAALVTLRRRLDAVYAGAPAAGVDRALAHVVARCEIPRSLLDELLEGFVWDVEGRRYEDLDGVMDYAMRVAGSVGAMMALIMGVRLPAALKAAAELGCAMQLTNIARDVGEDARTGRLYLPLAWLREAGIAPEAWVASPVFSDALGRVVARLLAEAERLYASADPGISALPRGCRPAIRSASLLYEGIGREVERLGYDSVSARAVVPAGRKVRLLVLGLVSGRQSIWQRMDDRIGWTLELFARLESEAAARKQWSAGVGPADRVAGRTADHASA